MKHMNQVMTGCIALATGIASAGSFSSDSAVRVSSEGSGSGGTLTLEFDRLAAGGATVVVNGSNYPAGHIVHTVLDGPQAGTSFATFCVEIQQNVASGPTVYDIVDLTDARVPGPTLTQEQADRINAVVANAVALGWIDRRLQANEGQDGFVSRMAAIQAAIWNAMDLDVDMDNPATNNAARDAYLTLLDAATFDPALRLTNLRALANPNGQDMLYVVPLPPAAWAGAGLLVAVSGVRAWRRRA